MSPEDLKQEDVTSSVTTSRASLPYAWLALVLVVAAIAYVIGDRVGYQHGFAIAYTAEHSHFMFEKRRADRFQGRITDQRRCINKMAGSISPVESGGFAALGEVMQRFGLIYWGTVRCNQTAGFGYVNQQQIRRIMPSTND